MSIGLHANAEKLASLLPPLLIDAERVAQSVWYGVHGRRRAGMGESFWQFRRYDTGDPAERIDWRQSARTDKIYVREREWEAAENVCLWADTSGSMRYSSAKNIPTKADQAQLLMLALASLLLRGGEKAWWRDGQHFTAVHNKIALERIASLYRPDTDSLPPLPPTQRHAHMVLASDFLMPDGSLQTAMQHYAAQNLSGILLHIIDPLEASFALDGRVELQGAEGEAPVLLSSAASLRDAYQQRFVEHKEQLKHIAKSAGWHYLQHATNQAPQQILLRLYQYLAGQ